MRLSRAARALWMGFSMAVCGWMLPGRVLAQRALEVTPPHLTEQADPEFVGDTRDRAERGILSFYLLVGRTGTVRSVHLIHGLGDAMDGRVQAAMWRYRFEPATQEGIAVPAWVRVDFLLNEGTRGRRQGLQRR